MHVLDISIDTSNIQQPQPASVYSGLSDIFAINNQTEGFNYVNSLFEGSKYLGGMKYGIFSAVDFPELRRKSHDLFIKNPYGYGIIDRLVSNEIATGLTLECLPEESLLNLTREQAEEWSTEVEILFKLWGENPQLCDANKLDPLSELQKKIRLNALVDGDCLIILKQSSATLLPMIDIIPGHRVESPVFSKSKKTRTIRNGIEYNSAGKEIAYYVKTKDKTGMVEEHKRISAYGEKSKRRIAFMYRQKSGLIEHNRGMPILGVIMQSLQDIDNFKDSELRAAALNALFAMWVKNPENAGYTSGIGRAAATKTVVTPSTGVNPRVNSIEFNGISPGVILDNLAAGQELVSQNTARPNANFANFHDSILQVISWSISIPPEILQQSFNSNYSASTKATREFNNYLEIVRTHFGTYVLKMIYTEWLLSMVLKGLIKADSFIDAYLDKNKFHILGAWVSADWSGQVKIGSNPVEDLTYQFGLVSIGATTFDKAAKALTGKNYVRNIKKQLTERDLLKSVQDIYFIQPPKVTLEENEKMEQETGQVDNASTE
jgi:capsid protein